MNPIAKYMYAVNEAFWKENTPEQQWRKLLVGDQVIALYLPGFAGTEHAAVAVGAAKELLAATGHTDAGGPWIPVGIGI